MVRGTAEILPHPDVRYTEVYAFMGLGAFFSGNYYVVSVTHTWNQNGYVSTKLEVIKQQWDGTAVVTETSSIYKDDGREPRPVVQPKTQPRYHTVVAGDTLWAIAEYYYGDGMKWKIIEQANHDMLVSRDPRNATDLGHWIYPGQQLVIP